MTEHNVIPNEDLHAFIDGELSQARASALAAEIERDPGLAKRAAAFRADKKKLIEIYGPLIDKPLPSQWLAMIDRHRNRRPWFQFALSPMFVAQRTMLAAAAAVVILIAGWTIMQTASLRDDDALVAEALSVWADSTASNNRTPDQTTFSADADLKAALGDHLKAPDLSKMGFKLTSVRVYAGTAGKKAVKLDYRDSQNRLFALYLQASPGNERFDMIKRGNVRICVWQDDVLSTVMLGDVTAAEMLRLASLAYTGLNA